MRVHRLLRPRPALLAALVALCPLACSDDGDDGLSAEDLEDLLDTGFELPDGEWETSGPPVPDAAGDESCGGDDDGGPHDDDDDDDDDEMNGSTGGEDDMGGVEDEEDDDGGTSGGEVGFPDGSQCSAAPECASGGCAVFGPLGGICGECDEDADCEFGCSFGSPVTSEGPTCNDGELGGGCETDAACAGGLQCEPVLSIPGFVNVSTCSECGSDADCPGLCSPSVEVGSFGGAWECVAPGELGNGQTCDFEGSGDQACASGHCAEASAAGLIAVGICSACEGDQDCASGTCIEPSVEIDGRTTPGYCS